MTTFRWSVGSSIIILSLALGISLLTNTKSVAKPGEISSGISEQKLERQVLLVEPALKQFTELFRETAELALLSGLLTRSPHINFDLTDGVDNREESVFLIELYAAKYGVEAPLLEEVVRCESTYDPTETGGEGERGSTQFMYETWLETPQGQYGWDAAYHPAVNIEAAAWMLSKGRIEEFHAVPCPDR